MDGSFTIYSTLSEEDVKFLKTNPSIQTRSIWAIMWSIVNFIMSVRSAGIFACKVIQYVSNENVCGYIGKELLNSLVPNKRYKATAVLKKNQSCVPSHSAQCNSYPNAYWETVVQPA